MKKFIVLLFSFIFASSASAAIYKWVDKEGVVNFTDDESKVPSAYRNKVEEFNITKTGVPIPSRTAPVKMAANTQPGGAGKQDPPIAQTLVREGDFAVKLAEVLKVGQAKSEAEAENMLASVGIAPKNGWIADYPITPDIIGELQNAIGSAVDSGNLGMKKEEAVKTFQDLAAGQGLPVQVDERQNPVGPPQDYGESEAVDNYYYTEGPPVVTYYPPPWDYNYLYGWVPYPFWYGAFWFPGFFILSDFHVHHGHHHWISNHYVDPVTHTSQSVNAATRTTATAATRTTAGTAATSTTTGTSSRGFASSAARTGAASILNRSVSGRTFGQPGNTAGRQYQSFQRQSTGSGRSFSSNNASGRSFSSSRGFSSPSSRSFSARGGRSFSSGSRGGGYSGGSRGGGGFGGSHGGGHGGGHR